MTFNEFESRVSAYIDDELSPVDMAAMDRKAAECERCRALLAGVQAQTERLGQLPQMQPSAEFNFALRSHLLMEVVNEKRALHNVRRVLFSSVARTVATLAAAVVLGLGLTQVISEDSTFPEPQMAVETEIPLVAGKTMSSIDVGALELERLKKQSYSLDSRLYRDSARVDSAARFEQLSPDVRGQKNVKPVPVSYSF